MNDTEQTQKRNVKPFAIAGFIFMILVIAWLSVQLINVLPSAFSSLASLAEGVNSYQETLSEDPKSVTFSVQSNTELMNAGATIDLAWDAVDPAGIYTFSYNCVDGVAISILDADGETSVSCDNSYNIGAETTLTLSVESEKDRYADITYTIGYISEDTVATYSEASDSFTVINSTIPEPNTEIVADDTPETATSTPRETEPEIVVDPNTPASTPTAPAPETVYNYTYQLPESNPNGFTDLGITIIGTGQLINDTFLLHTANQTTANAIQFTVTNFGTKTSDEWEYSIQLPNDASYTATDQAPLKPNETATITVGFDAPNNTRHTFAIDIDTTSDTNNRNDSKRTTLTLD